MTKINWDKFKVKNEDYRKSFEELAYFLFCRKFKRNTGIFRLGVNNLAQRGDTFAPYETRNIQTTF
jgi:hypothetical protein